MSIAGCGQGAADQPSPAAALIGRTFVSAPDPADGQTRQLVAGSRVRLSFEPGTLSAEAGCNHLTATVTPDDQRLVVSDVGGTMMACPAALMDQDAWLTGFLQEGPRWQLTGDVLLLSTGTARLRLVDIRSAEPDRPLAGPRWSVQTLVQGDTAASVPAGTQAHLVFGAGRVTGSAGCTGLDGAVTVSDTTVTFGQITARGRDCSPESRALDRAVLGMLRGTLSYRITGAQLMLTHPDGRALQLRTTS
ncbi:META domain-containing protein [Krasilnikovia cinnamomea]|uniref:META domain-containing protein n=1 Tax=Krasilnikovia cinnamomea TaxID=349313 RepID=A0A4Q7ZQA5_9ACTN|nr:META domain-containing protein [Krasilnikovia cinnamomea]RZU52723.1 META domain-containing protein [Krasilnikovia cinnamomea]